MHNDIRRRSQSRHICLAKQRKGRHVESYWHAKLMRKSHGGQIGLAEQRNGRHVELH